MSIWIAAARLRTLPAAVVPVVVGTAVAYAAGHIAWGPALAALAGSLAIQIGTNFANDVFDAEKGADGPDRIGPTRAVAAGLISAAAMKRAMILAFAIATAFGLYLASVGGWPIVAIGLASIASGIAYTGGPWPLGYHGLGDVFVFIFFGLVAVCGTAYVQLAAVPCLTDVRVGKRTLAVRLGRGGALAEYALLLVASYAVAIGLAVAHRDAWLLLPLVSLPLGAIRMRALARAVTGPEFNACLAATGKLLLAYGVLFAIGLCS